MKFGTVCREYVKPEWSCANVGVPAAYVNFYDPKSNQGKAAALTGVPVLQEAMARVCEGTPPFVVMNHFFLRQAKHERFALAKLMISWVGVTKFKGAILLCDGSFVLPENEVRQVVSITMIPYLEDPRAIIQGNFAGMHSRDQVYIRLRGSEDVGKANGIIECMAKQKNCNPVLVVASSDESVLDAVYGNWDGWRRRFEMRFIRQ